MRSCNNKKCGYGENRRYAKYCPRCGDEFPSWKNRISALARETKKIDLETVLGGVVISALISLLGAIVIFGKPYTNQPTERQIAKQDCRTSNLHYWDYREHAGLQLPPESVQIEGENEVYFP
ncbi:MAG: hypothetical protein ABH864_02190 [archaeon]